MGKHTHGHTPGMGPLAGKDSITVPAGWCAPSELLYKLPEPSFSDAEFWRSITDDLIDMHERCKHCGAGPDADGDHSCPCPHTDADCPDHP